MKIDARTEILRQINTPNIRFGFEWTRSEQVSSEVIDAAVVAAQAFAIGPKIKVDPMFSTITLDWNPEFDLTIVINGLGDISRLKG